MHDEKVVAFITATQQQLRSMISYEKPELTIEEVDRAMKKAYEMVYTSPMPKNKQPDNSKPGNNPGETIETFNQRKIMCPCGNAEITFTMKN